MKQRIQDSELRSAKVGCIPVAPRSRQASRRTCLAWREDSASERSQSEDGRRNKAPWPWWPEPIIAFAKATASGPVRLSSCDGEGEGSFSGDGARTAQQAIPQQNPVSVPQQQFVDCDGANNTCVLLSAQTIIWGNSPVRPKLTIKLAVIRHRNVRRLQDIISIISRGYIANTGSVIFADFFDNARSFPLSDLHSPCSLMFVWQPILPVKTFRSCVFFR